MSNQNSDSAAMGCAMLVGIAVVLWLLLALITKVVEIVTDILTAVWQFITWVGTSIWNAIVAVCQFVVWLMTSLWNAIVAVLTFLVQPRSLAVIFGAVAIYGLWLGMKKYLARLHLTVAEDEALIVERWGQYNNTLYRGLHQLPFGAMVRSRLSLRPMHFACNDEEFLTSDLVRVRLRCSFDAHITNAQMAYTNGMSRFSKLRQTMLYYQGKTEDPKQQFAAQVLSAARKALLREMMHTEFMQLLAQPEAVLQRITEQVNLYVYEYGLKITNFCFEELTQPDELLKLHHMKWSGAYWEYNATVDHMRHELQQAQSAPTAK